MKTETGGTLMWCPTCKAVTSCKSVYVRHVNQYVATARRLYRTNHDDVQFYRRGRKCQTCGHGFMTAETREDFIDELVELRDTLAAIKHDTEQYIADSEKTSKSLGSLNESLGKLRALKIYQKQKSK
ncbi:MAG: hypothetical protein HOP18_11970 [Deltaproteobacteria bacterium]|nr:hypothetical protein [Deltaproteobacteria bacterium]